MAPGEKGSGQRPAAAAPVRRVPFLTHRAREMCAPGTGLGRWACLKREQLHADLLPHQLGCEGWQPVQNDGSNRSP